MTTGEIELFQSKDKRIELQVTLHQDSVWLTQKQMAQLFEKDVRTISEHIQNIFSEGELQSKAVIRKFRIPADDGKSYDTQCYNLDVIISVGYRVKSQRGTQFRMWATRTLKNDIIEGYKTSQKEIITSTKKLNELQKVISFFQQKARNALMAGQEKELLNLLATFAKSLSLLGQYDAEDIFVLPGQRPHYQLTYEEAKDIIVKLKQELIGRKEASELFGREFPGKYESVIGTLYQTFDGRELYPTIEEKAAHLLYLSIKDHPFTDGNKRIGSFMFVYFLNRNKYLYKKGGEKKINDNALVSLALLIAVSDPKEKDTMIALVSHLLQ